MLASQLAIDPTRRVRVFIDDPATLSPISARIDSSLWVQPLATGELWRLRLADVVAPADNVVCMDGCELPTRYRERIAYGAGTQRRVLRVWSLGQSPKEPEASTAGDRLSSLSFDVMQEESPTGTGLIKAHRSTADMRARWKVQGDLTQTTLEGVGFRGHLPRGSLIFLCWGFNIPSPVQFCRLLERVCEKPILLITASLGDSPVQAISCAGEALSCQSLNLPTWSQMDELIWSSDFVFCLHKDIANRAMEAGAPMLWLREDEGLFNWYFEGIDAGFKRCLVAVAYHLRSVGTPSSDLLWLLNQRAALEVVAKSVARRFAQAPLLADSLPQMGPRLAEQARLRQQGFRISHQPTTPMNLPSN